MMLRYTCISVCVVVLWAFQRPCQWYPPRSADFNDLC